MKNVTNSGFRAAKTSRNNRVQYAVAPHGGLPPRVGKKPTATLCWPVIVSPISFSTNVGDVERGDLVRVAPQILVRNWTFSTAAADGDRLIQVADHQPVTDLVGWDCDNTSNPDSGFFLFYDPTQ